MTRCRAVAFAAPAGAWLLAFAEYAFVRMIRLLSQAFGGRPLSVVCNAHDFSLRFFFVDIYTMIVCRSV